jgi:hypothetical protein
MATVTVPSTTAVPRWVDRTAHAVVWTTVPSGLWRIALGLGVPVGFHGELAEVFAAPGWAITPYVIALSLAVEGLALLTLGLVRPWGEVFPRWMPVVGGRRVPTTAAVTAAGLGALAVTWIVVTMALSWTDPDANGGPDAPHGVAGLVMTACYAPLLAWGPLLAVVTVAYAVRRRRQAEGRTRPQS